MIDTISVPILTCQRCGNRFAPVIDTEKMTVRIPSRCPARNCRSETWNIPENELVQIKEKRKENLRLGPQTRRGKSYPSEYRVEKIRNISKDVGTIPSTHFCEECEIFYADSQSLERHLKRRHHGMCMVCHSSAVSVRMVDGRNVCVNCEK